MWNWKALKSSLCPQVTTSDLSSLKIYLYWIVQMKRNILIAIQMLWKCVVEKMKLCLPDTIIMHPFISYKLSDITEPNHPTQCFFIFSLFFFSLKNISADSFELRQLLLNNIIAYETCAFHSGTVLSKLYL